MTRISRRNVLAAILVGLMLSLASGTALAQYSKSNLVTNLPTGAKHTGDKQLLNPWGLAYAPGGAFWLSDAGSGLSTPL